MSLLSLRSICTTALAVLQLSAGGTSEAGQSEAGQSDSRRAGQVRILASVPSEMVRVSAGAFDMGMPDSEEEFEFLTMLCTEDYRTAAEKFCHDIVSFLQPAAPAREVQLDSFEIDRYEVTVAQFRECVQAGACDVGALLFGDQRHNQPEMPVGNTHWQDASDYCKWRGKRLPSEAEWEKAARGTQSFRFPWGVRWIQRAANHGRFDFKREMELLSQPGSSTLGGFPLHDSYFYAGDKIDGAAYAAPPGSMIWGESPYGAMDMAGNVSEWVFDYYAEAGYADLPSINPIRDTPLGMESRRVLRSGSWNQPRLLQLAYSRRGEPPSFRAMDVGFRCAR